MLCAAARVSAASPPAVAGTQTGLPGYAIIRLGQGHNNRLRLAATIGGKKGLLVLDTGADHTVLNESTYRFLLASTGGKLPAGVPGKVNVNGMSTRVVVAPDFYIGSNNLGALPVALIPAFYMLDHSLMTHEDQLYDGFLGENLLRHYNAIVDCGRLALYLNTNPAKKLSLSAAFRRNGWTAVPMSDCGNNFTVPCRLNALPFRLLVDTGAPFTDLNRSLLAGAHVASRALSSVRGGLIGRHAGEVGLARLDSVRIGDYTATGVYAATTVESFAGFGAYGGHQASAPLAGLLGGDFLARNLAVIDIGNKILYLKHGPGAGSSVRQ